MGKWKRQQQQEQHTTQPDKQFNADLIYWLTGALRSMCDENLAIEKEIESCEKKETAFESSDNWNGSVQMIGTKVHSHRFYAGTTLRYSFDALSSFICTLLSHCTHSPFSFYPKSRRFTKAIIEFLARTILFVSAVQRTKISRVIHFNLQFKSTFYGVLSVSKCDAMRNALNWICQKCILPGFELSSMETCMFSALSEIENVQCPFSAMSWLQRMLQRCRNWLCSLMALSYRFHIEHPEGKSASNKFQNVQINRFDANTPFDGVFEQMSHGLGLNFVVMRCANRKVIFKKKMFWIKSSVSFHQLKRVVIDRLSINGFMTMWHKQAS